MKMKVFFGKKLILCFDGLFLDLRVCLFFFFFGQKFVQVVNDLRAMQ